MRIRIIAACLASALIPFGITALAASGHKAHKATHRAPRGPRGPRGLQGPRGGQGERGPTGPAQATIVLTDRGERGPKGETGESALNPELEIAYIDQRGVSEYGSTIEEIKAGSAAGTAIQATSTCPPNRPYLIGGGGYTEPESGQGVVLTASHRAAGETPTWQVQAEATRTTSATVLLFAEAVCAQIKN